MSKFNEMLDVAKTIATELGLVLNVGNRGVTCFVGDAPVDHRAAGDVMAVASAFAKKYLDYISLSPDAYLFVSNNYVCFSVTCVGAFERMKEAQFHFQTWRSYVDGKPNYYIDVWFEEGNSRY